jgi:transposase InsO family protein
MRESMRIRNTVAGTKGFVVAWERLIRFKYMISEKAKKRVKILVFWEKYGDDAVHDAYGVSRATLYRWQKALHDCGGKLEGLNPTSTAPRRRRQRTIPDAVRAFILRERTYDPHIGKEKLAILMKEDGVANLSPSTVGRILADMKKRGELPNRTKYSYYAKTGTWREQTVQRRTKLRSKVHEGTLTKADTVVRFHDGIKRYIVTALDTGGKFAFAYAYKNHSSIATTHFMDQYRYVTPVPVSHVQTDNGSEFEKHFHLYLGTHDIVHFNTYPRSPKQNAEIERFNRTLSEAFISQNRALLAYDIDTFNEKLMDWLLWYNTRRPHWSLGLISPLRYYCDQLKARESQMLWTNTKA